MGSPHVLIDPPRAALIGGGFIGPVHAEALRRIGVEVVGVLGSSRERALATARPLGIPRAYGDLDELLADDRVGAVHVASPNASHVEQACRCLEAGLHVVCEKPLATTPAETVELRRLAEARPGQASAVNYNVRYYPLCHEMRARVVRGDVGRVVGVFGSYTQDWLLLPTDYNWRVEPDGGTNLRAVADIGTHWMDLAQFVTGRRIRSVMADLDTVHPTRERPAGPTETFGGGTSGARVPVAISTEDQASVLLRLEDGLRGSFHVSQVLAGRKNRLLLEVAGTEASMAWDSEEPNRLWIGRRGGANHLLERDPALMRPEAAAISHYPGGHAEGFPDTFARLFQDVYGHVASATTAAASYPTFVDGDREVRLCDAIARSAREGRWAEVEGD